MGCPFIDRRYGQNCCGATDSYIEWDNYCNTCSNSTDYRTCDNYKRENSKRENVSYVSSY